VEHVFINRFISLPCVRSKSCGSIRQCIFFAIANVMLGECFSETGAHQDAAFQEDQINHFPELSTVALLP